MSAQELITAHLDLWTGAVTKKSSSGRGSNGKVELSGVKKLRELILELAVNGKLLEQYPDDTPANGLLERAAEARKQLIASKTLKNSKPLPPVTTDEAPSKLPAGWVWTRLGSIAEINPRNTGDDALEVSFVPMPLVSTSYHGEHGEQPRKWSEIKQGYSHFANGDIGLAKITPCFENSKAAVFSNLRNGIGAGTTELHVARPLSPEINPYYLLLCLKSPRFLTEGVKVMTGSAGQKRVPKSYFAETPLPLPPEEEQHRIVQKVDELMALCDRLEQQTSDQLEAHETLVDTLLDSLLKPAEGSLTQSDNLTELADNWARLAAHFDTLFTTEQRIDKLKQTILQLAVMGRLVEQDAGAEHAESLLDRLTENRKAWLQEQSSNNPECRTMLRKLNKLSQPKPAFALPLGWKPAHLIQLCLMLVDCHNKTAPYTDNGIPIIRTSNIRERRFVYDELKYVDEDTYKYWSRRCPPEPGDIIFTREAPMGEAAIIPEDKTWCLGQRTMLIRPMHEHINNRFLLLVLTEPHLLERASEKAIGSTVKHLRVGDVENIIVPIPPLEEQHRIVQKVDELMALCDQLKERLNQAGETRCQLAEAVVNNAVS